MLSNNKKTNHKLLFIPTYVEGAVQHLHFEVFIYVLKSKIILPRRSS